MSFRSGPKHAYPNEHLQFPSDDIEQFSFNRVEETPSFQGSPARQRTHGFQQLVHNSANNHNQSSKIDEEEQEASLSNSSGKKSTSDTVVVNIKIGPNVMKEIRCELKDDNSTILDRVKKFCRENSLDQQAIPLIINMIKQQFLKIHKQIKENEKDSEENGSSRGKNIPVSPKFNYSPPKSAQERDPAEKQQKPKLIGKLDVAIAPSKTKVLKLYSDQFPELVASDFCLENHLPSELVQILSQKLTEIKERYDQKSKQAEGQQSLRTEIRHTFGKKPPQSKNDDSSSLEEISREYKNEISDKKTVQKNLFGAGGGGGGYPERTDDISPTSSPSFVKQKTAAFSKPDEEISNISEARSDNETPSQRNTCNESDTGQQQSSERQPTLERGRESDTAQAYERWATLIKDKNLMKQEVKEKHQDRRKDDKSADRVTPLSKPKEAFLIGNPKPKTPRGGQRMHTTEDSTDNLSSETSARMTKEKQDELLNRLYYSGMASKNFGSERQQHLKEKKQKEEDKELTFHPKISKSPRKTQKPEKEPEYTSKTYREHRDRVSDLESKELRAKQEQFPFKPKVSDISTELAVRSRSRSPIHNKLYLEGMLQKDHNTKVRDIMFRQRHPFSPRLPSDIDNFLSKRPKQNQKEFTNRLVKEGVIREQQMTMRRAIERDDVKDSKTGQPLFHPVVPHDKYYYNLKRKEQEKSQNRSRSTTPQNKEYQSVHIPVEPKSTSILGKTFSQNPLRKIFERLDSDGDGLISAKKIDLSQVDAQVLEALLDLMDFLENNHATLDYQGFLTVIDKLEIEDQVLKAFNAGNPHPLVLKTEPEPLPDLFQFNDQEHADISPTKYSEVDDRNYKHLVKNPSKRSDFSTASSNHTENNSAQIPKHYRELLDKKFSVRKNN